MARVSLRLWIGVALIAVAMFWNAAWNQWANAHNWMPLLKPIALSAGYRASARFEIETPGTYFVALNARIPNTGSDYQCFVGDLCGTNSPKIAVAWTASRNGGTAAPSRIESGGLFLPYAQSGNDMTRELGTFYAERGEYTIDFDVLKDGGEYASAEPALVVFETGMAQEAVSSRLAAALFFGAIGIIGGTLLLIASALKAWRKRQERLARCYSLTEPGPLPRRFQCDPQPAALSTRRPIFWKERSAWMGPLLIAGGLASFDESTALHYWISLLVLGSGASLLLILWTRVRPHRAVAVASGGSPGTVLSRSYWKPQRGLPPARMPAFGLMGVNILIVLVSIMSVAQSFDRVAPVGLRIRLLRPVVNVQPMIGIQPVLVRLEFRGNKRPPVVYIDSHPVSWEDFDAVLRKDIYERPPHWPVYLQGDPELDWGSVAEPIDRIRGLDAEVILLTRHSRRASTDARPSDRPR